PEQLGLRVAEKLAGTGVGENDGAVPVDDQDAVRRRQKQGTVARAALPIGGWHGEAMVTDSLPAPRAGAVYAVNTAQRPIGERQFSKNSECREIGLETVARAATLILISFLIVTLFAGVLLALETSLAPR